MIRTTLTLPDAWRGARRAVTSLPWPAARTDVPVAGIASQAVALFEPHATPRLRRYLWLGAEPTGLPAELEIHGGKPAPAEPFARVEIVTLRENLAKGQSNYRECAAQLRVAGRVMDLRLGLRLPTGEVTGWQWCQAERLWSGPVAEGWRIGGHLVPYPADAPGASAKTDLLSLGERITQQCGDVLHGDLFLIVWRTGEVDVTAHFKAGYFHTWPKPIRAFPVVVVDGRVTQPWDDLRVLANKTKDNQFVHLEPGERDVLPPGVSRSYRFSIGEPAARYQVAPAWYRQCGVIETSHTGPAAEMAERSASLIREYTVKEGFEAGRVWRYLRRDLRTGIPQEDGPEWEGNLAQAMFALAYQTGESPAEHWDLYLHHAYHAADVAIYHGSWMARLECAAAFSSPLPKFRFGGLLAGYLETGDPYLLETARSLAGVYMAMEWAHQPRAAMGRDAYPLTSLLALWDYTAESLYLDFARQTARRLLATQQPDGGFAGQAGAGAVTGANCLPAAESIGFGSGLLAPLALLEWAARDRRWPDDFLPRLHAWVELMLRLQPADGVWRSNDAPYPLIGAAAQFSLLQAGEFLHDDRCREAIALFLETMNARQDCVTGTHSFLAALYAHAADAALATEAAVVS